MRYKETKVMLIYSDDCVQIKHTHEDAYRLFGANVNGKRPIRAILPSEVKFSNEFLCSLIKTMAPRMGRSFIFYTS